MLDIKFIRVNAEKVKSALAKRGDTSGIDRLLELDARRREAITEVEAFKNRKNLASKRVASAISTGKDPAGIINDIKQLTQQIDAYEAEVGDIDENMAEIMLNIPNIPDISVLSGGEKRDNRFVKQTSGKKEFAFNPLPHWELGECLKILDFESAARMSGSNFPLYRGMGARLERALYTFMVELHVKEHGYEEIIPPYMVTRECMVGTGQLPKLEEDMYRCEQDDLFLIPTAEVPLVNMHRGRILDERALPLSYVSYTPCFRREAGSYGKETRGLMRVHQFDKVELVKFTRPEESYHELERMLSDAEEVVRRLGLTYRVFELCAEELSFASSKTYDIEVWAPGVERWLEVASISNCEEFQARRADIRCRRKEGKGTFHPHTLNGSGVALARTYLAILEHYQNSDGSVTVPEALAPYMDGVKVIQ